jgi:hypothetical protein
MTFSTLNFIYTNYGKLGNPSLQFGDNLQKWEKVEIDHLSVRILKFYNIYSNRSHTPFYRSKIGWKYLKKEV